MRHAFNPIFPRLLALLIVANVSGCIIIKDRSYGKTIIVDGNTKDERRTNKQPLFSSQVVGEHSSFFLAGVNEKNKTIVNLYLQSIAQDTFRFEARIFDFEKTRDVSIEFSVLLRAFGAIQMESLSADNYRIIIDSADTRPGTTTRAQNLLLDFSTDSYQGLLVTYSGTFEDEESNRIQFRALTDPLSQTVAVGMARIACKFSARWKIILQACKDKIDKKRQECGNKGVMENYVRVKSIVSLMDIAGLSFGDVYDCQPKCK
jgi:hypothetical protein